MAGDGMRDSISGELAEKRERLYGRLLELGRVLVAYSGEWIRRTWPGRRTPC